TRSNGAKPLSAESHAKAQSRAQRTEANDGQIFKRIYPAAKMQCAFFCLSFPFRSLRLCASAREKKRAKGVDARRSAGDARHLRDSRRLHVHGRARSRRAMEA